MKTLQLSRLALQLILTTVLSGTVAMAAESEPFPELKNTEKATTSPMAPDEVVRTAKLPEGFQLSVFAAEPDVQNPIAITTDERGRLWVAENYSWAGAGAGGFDGTQRDRLVVLEDTDGDGKHDKRTVFFDDARKLTSIEVGYGGVWAICLPNLLFFPDANRDDVPDGPPQVVLDGIDEGVVGHTPANGLKWGPDGWLYARHGIQAASSIGAPCASDSQRIKINTGVWRYHPTRKVVEDVMHGMTNSWGYDYDQHGEMFVINTVIGHLWHTVYGAHTQRMYGVDINPHSYALIAQTADHVHWDTGEVWGDVRKGLSDKTSAAGGGHAHIGLMIYQGDNWPHEYRNRLYTLNLHGLRINCDILERLGAGYTAKHGPDLCFLKDPWFRGMDLITGPDGGVYIADWSDTGECHDHDGVHRTSGRIYKLTYGKPKAVPAFDLTKLKSHELVQLQINDNVWWARQARRVLAERAAADPKSRDVVDARHDLLRLLEEQIDPARRCRAIETLYGLNGLSEDWLLHKLSDHEEHERVLALRLVVDQLTPAVAPSPALLQSLEQSAKTDASGLVQLYLASALQRLPIAARWPIAEALVTKTEFANDRMLPLMVWYGIEPAIAGDPERAVKLAIASQMPIITEHVARRLTVEIDRNPQAVAELLDAATAGRVVQSESVVNGMAHALRGWQKAAPPAGWDKATEHFAKSDSADVRRHVQELGVVFGDGRALDELRKIVNDGGADANARRQALRALLTGKPADFAPTLFNLAGDRALALDAIRGLAQYDHADTPKALFDRLGGFGPAERSEMIATLASRPGYATWLLAALRNGTLKANEVSAFHARQIASFENPELTKDLTELWGEVRVSAADKKALIERYKTELNTESLSHADLSAGRATFAKTCANCHVLYGAGRKLGPDITGSNRKNIDYLLENIVDPSASVGVGFRAITVLLDDGRVLSGVVSEQNERTLTLQTALEAITIDRETIDEMKPTANSLMPDGLLQNLTAEQTRDLIGYLMSSEQAPLPK